MAKNGVKFCDKCGCYTKHIYVGKRAASGDDIATAIFSLGLSLLVDPRPKFWECEKCGNITKN